MREAKTKKDMLKARAKAAKASEQINQAMSQVDTSGALSAFERMEEKVLGMEAQSAAVAELSGDSLEDQFAALEAGSDVDEELELMKAQLEPSEPAPSLPPGEQVPVNTSTDAELEKLREELDQL